MSEDRIDKGCSAAKQLDNNRWNTLNRWEGNEDSHERMSRIVREDNATKHTSDDNVRKFIKDNE